MTLKWKFGNDLSYFSMGHYPVPDFIDRKVAIDVGCNMGAFSIKHKNRFDNIYFLEACYENYEQIKRNLETHKADNCFGFNLAAGGETGKILKLKQWTHGVGGSQCGSSATVDHEAWEGVDYHPVMSISLEDTLKLFEVDRVNYFKIDCEGAEYDFLMDKDLSNIDCIGMELHPGIRDPADHEKLVSHIGKFFDVFSGTTRINPGHNNDVVFVNKSVKR